MHEDSLKLENQLCHRLYTASNAMTRAYRPLLSELDLTYPQYLVMLALWQKDQIQVNRLIELTLIDGGSLTQILAKLQEKELLKSRTASDDRRKRLLCLTPKGQALKQAALKIPGLMLCKLKSLSLKEFQTLIELIDKLNQDLEI
ncbi:MarR family transcriptional regulator [bacterium (Candidatus Blackallbacteria) CG17_big_fil_post_rev_8_21_14_2_50_48_46]|uniref:MarR family transcriptional regulator n=1 Tax=bacterium (Candidatus Blackallbacteria) CG17_big_fil_post_rev_8_21_14_2_50_48_46 TaxID=2014261 RepID=A0A2M7G0M5_9BACT|nr:MAG: MarR family transcriptional regulator [bacterium (Candidatus Blackallbacteria) CG18_big_fil_WC_8_21_14_2_50_49_26]PIW15268.1 MAG: MarR family transcriptional regulator [bacterium (Candidatus Blackallbacteria) CG17_big_fil_post_rev_8_21_14_2_50_48_46]PIW45223.1 MAG: MarR family transcriptional regulator [bacterium (Candidatus Blackallbacteria) CG13_big_fil_rev_8_21_14_2_50_49_14]